MVKELVEANNWKANLLCSYLFNDSKIGLQDYLKMEGMTFRLVPETQTGSEL